MKVTLDTNKPISGTEQAILLANLYHFFEMKVKDMSFENFLKCHEIWPNPSAYLIYVVHPEK